MKFFSKSIFSPVIIVLFVLAIGGATEIRAQSPNINDDLKPVKTKPANVSRQKPVKRAKPPKVVKPSVRRAPAAAAVAAPVETPAEIIARYMNFQQSATVSGGDWESVVRQTNATLQADPGNKMAKTQLAVAQGQIAFNRGDYSNALIQFNAAAQLMPESALPFYDIGKVYLSTRQPNEAEDAFEKAIKLNRSFALAYKGLGDALSAQGKAKKARDYYKQAAQMGVAVSRTGGGSATAATNRNLAPQNSVAVPLTETPAERELKVARALTEHRKWKESLQKLQPLTASSPSSELYILMGDNYVGMKAWISAQQAYRKALELDPNSAPAAYKSGQVLYETNEFQAAADAFEKSLILDQNGRTINRNEARRMADKSAGKARGDKKRFLVM